MIRNEGSLTRAEAGEETHIDSTEKSCAAFRSEEDGTVIVDILATAEYLSSGDTRRTSVTGNVRVMQPISDRSINLTLTIRHIQGRKRYPFGRPPQRLKTHIPYTPRSNVISPLEVTVLPVPFAVMHCEESSCTRLAVIRDRSSFYRSHLRTTFTTHGRT